MEIIFFTNFVANRYFPCYWVTVISAKTVLSDSNYMRNHVTLEFLWNFSVRSEWPCVIHVILFVHGATCLQNLFLTMIKECNLKKKIRDPYNMVINHLGSLSIAQHTLRGADWWEGGEGRRLITFNIMFIPLDIFMKKYSKWIHVFREICHVIYE